MKDIDNDRHRVAKAAETNHPLSGFSGLLAGYLYARALLLFVLEALQGADRTGSELNEYVAFRRRLNATCTVNDGF